MECKYKKKHKTYTRYRVEVAPYWNVNVVDVEYDNLRGQVEVAPYWNVNLQAIERKEKEEAVEVAPYWNVNSFY